MISRECGGRKHGKCLGSFEVRERGERVIVFCECLCHKREEVLAV